LENLIWLSRTEPPVRISEMQLVLFETPEISNIPSEREAAALASEAAARGMAFTVHLPGSIELGNPDARIRAASVDLFQRVVGLTRALEPICWTLHIPSPAREDAESYIDRAEYTLAPLLGEFASPRELAIENIYPVFDVESRIAEDLDTSVCIDAGHLICFGQDVWSFMDRWMARCRNIHLHGCRGRSDHQSLALLPKGFLAEFLSRAALAPDLRVITMEVFGTQDFESSIEALREHLNYPE
jgi:sugar phosphate isomerase/epimerase